MNDWVWSLIDFKWEQGFKCLKQYVEDEGDALVPARHKTSDGFNLGNWVSVQRNSKDDMPHERRERLEALNGWVWDPLIFQWEQGFKCLKQYVEDEGDALVPYMHQTPDGYNLGNWVSAQRGRKGNLSKDRKERLEELNGWVWETVEFRWEQKFKYLQQYVEDEGDAHVHAHHKTSDDFRLGAWVARQRRNKDDMSKERREKLKTLKGWVWRVMK